MSTTAPALFVRTPEDIVLNRSISSLSKDIYSFLQLHQFESDRSDFTRGQIADEFGVSVRTIARKMKELVEAGLLVVERMKSWCIYHIRDAIDHLSRRRQALKDEQTGRQTISDQRRPTNPPKRRRKNKYDHLSFGDPRGGKPWMSHPPRVRKEPLDFLDVDLRNKDVNDVILEVLTAIDTLVLRTDDPDDTKSILIDDEYEDDTEAWRRIMGKANYDEWIHCHNICRPYLGAVMNDEQYDQRYAIAKEHGLRMVR